MIAPEPTRRRASALLSLAAVAASFAAAVWPTWQRWGSLYVDVGRELELPRQLLDGGTLFGDVRCYYGPLAYWVNAGLYAIFGVRAGVLAAAGLASAAAFALGVWWLARRRAGDLAAAVVGAVVVQVCFFPHLVPNPSFNWALPYSFAATYGALALLGTVVALDRAARTGAPRDLALAAAAAALAVLLKLEAGVAALAAHAAFAVALAASGRLRRAHLLACAGVLAVPVAAYAVLFARHGDTVWTDNMGAMFGGGADVFFRYGAGLDDVGASLAAVARSAGAMLAALGAAAGLGWLARRPELPPPVSHALAGAGFLGAAAGFRALGAEDGFRAIPLALGVALAWAAVALFRAPKEERLSRAADLAFLVAALGLAGRMGLAAVARNYGFWLLPVALAAFATGALGRVPALLSPPGPGRLAAAAVGAGLLVGLAVPVVLESRRAWAEHTVRLETPRGTFVTQPDEVLGLVPLLHEMPPARTVVLPSGAGYSFLAGQPWGDASHTWLPMDMTGRYDDRATVARWSASPPEIVVWLPTRISHANEFGARGLGIDYGLLLSRFIQVRYEALVSPTPERPFWVFKLRR